jgi:nitrite reductase/ring-hydroxylating ferredoxin subunit
MTWVHAADAADLEGKSVIGVECDDLKLAIFRLADQFYATASVCTHASALLSEGEVVECYIECPAHYGLFDIRTGKAQGAPVSRDLRTYPVKVEGGRLLVRLDIVEA